MAQTVDSEMYRNAYFRVQEVLDEALGDGEDDGSRFRLADQ